MPWRLGTVTMLLLGVLTVPAWADDALLAEERWRETAFGLSLRPPAEARTIEQTADRALVTFLVGESMSIRLYFRQTQKAVTLEEVHERAAEQFVSLFPAAAIVQDEVAEVRIGQRRGARWYFIVPSEEGEWVAGQAFMMIDPYTVAMFQYESDSHSYEQSREMFEAVLESVELMSPQDLDAQRTALVEAGDAWLAQVSQAQMAAVLPERQWLRLLQDGRDVGYQRIESGPAEQLGEAGLEVRIQSHTLAGENHAYDSESQLFVADDVPIELWSLVTTLRPLQDRGGLQPSREQPNRSRRPVQPGGVTDSPIEALAEHWRQRPRVAGPQQSPEQGWADTGLRSHERITVSQEGPTEIDNKEWSVPPKAYLSQLAVQALPALLVEQARAGEVAKPMAFYAYHPNAGRLMLRTVRTEPADAGGWRVYDRPAPDRAEQTYRYDDRGRLIERRTGDGRVFKPATAEEIRTRWQGR
ncbi:MAG: hypothetical protein WD534_17110 [Phycisphaeraceae bacterium]